MNWLMRAGLGAAVVAFLAMTSGVRGAGPAADPNVVLLRVEDRSGVFEGTPRGALHMGSSANGWDPAAMLDTETIEPVGAAKGGWLVKLPRAVLERSGGAFEFKFTLGSWESVEVGAGGGDIANRTLPAAAWNKPGPGGDEAAPVIDLVIEGFKKAGAGGMAKSTVTGDLRLHQVASAVLGNTRTVRVWLPPGYGDSANAGVRYPVLYMHDGQNCFDAATSFAGEWGVDETATDLIQRGVIRPVIVVGIDNIGAVRSDEYSPIELGSIRPGTGGKGDAYLRFVETEVMTLVNKEYRTLTGPDNTFMGGSSLGGVITLHAAMSRPGLLGAILVESPSLWVGDGELKKRVLAHKEWPKRVFMAMGDKEYGSADRDGPLVAGAREVERSMREAGLGQDRLRFEIGVGAGHNEAAWAKRLPGALEFLLAKE